MGRYFPPSLQARGNSVKGGYGPSNYNTGGVTEIFFNMPAQNDVDALFGLDGSAGGHVQFTLKTKSNNTTAFNSKYSPDQVTVYFNAKSNYISLPTGSYTKPAQIVYYGGDLYSLVFGNALYMNPHDKTEIGPIAGKDYTIQIRFGDREISDATWSPPPAVENNGGIPGNFTGFANWRANAVTHAEFGEWSNTQSFYAYGPYTATLTANQNKWLPTFTFEYNTAYNDEITNVEIRCQYILPSGEQITETENFSGDLGTPGRFVLTRSVNIAPTDTLYIQVIPTTNHGTIIDDPAYTSYYPPAPNRGIAFGPYSNDTYADSYIDNGDPNLPIGDKERAPLLTSEELKDGVIAKRIHSPVITGGNSPYSLNIYRFDYFTREAVLLASGIDLSAGADPYIFKDYCVEMGTRYQYAGVVQDAVGNEGLMLWEMFSPFASGSDPYGELDKLEFSVLTDKYCQLRFQGNPTVSSFKRNVPESFQTTIGSEYPFYSRIGKSNYRSLSFGGVVSINFDFTSLFLELDSTNHSYEKRGLLWEKNLVVPIDKVYEQQQISLNRRRFNINNPFIAASAEDDNIPGPATIHNERLLASRKKKYNTKQSSDMIYLERVFRDKAMKWLSSGKPKLFRSETEGNMIVIASGVSFTPLQGSQRMVYSVQMTLTEIAEYNLTNLLKYNLLPCEIVADVEPNQTEFPGDYDPEYSDGILRFPDSESYDIPSVRNGRPIAPILIGYEQGLRVTGGVPPYSFEVLELPNTNINLHWEQQTRNGVDCLRIYGYPKNNLPPSIFTARVTDSLGTTASIQFQFGGTSDAGSVFSIDDIPSVTYDGTAQRPTVTVRENGVKIESGLTIVYSNNVDAGIATVTVTLPTGGVLMKSFNILRKTITVTQGTLRVTKEYDGTVSAELAEVTGAPALSETMTNATIRVTKGQYTSKVAGTNKNVSLGFSLQGTGALNYSLNPTAATWAVGVVTPKTVVVTPDSGQSKTYGSIDPVLTYTINPGLYAGDTVTGLLSRQAGTTVGEYEITLGTLSAGSSYNVTFTTGINFSITKASAPSLNWPQPTQIIYGQTLTDALPETVNAFGSFNWASPTTIPKVNNSGYQLVFTPNDTVNYDWSIPLSRTVVIQVATRQLSLVDIIATDREYDGTTNITVSNGVLTGIIGSDDVSSIISPATVGNKNVGNNKVVSFALSLIGADAGNYTIVQGGPVTVNITPKLVTLVSVVAEDRPYNGFTNVNVNIKIGGTIAGDSLETDYVGIGAIPSPDPGTNIPVNVSISLMGIDRNNYAVPPINVTVNITKGIQAPPPSPTLLSVTTNTIIVHSNANQEYSIDNGVTWQDSGVFSGLDPLTNYQIITRYKETPSLLPSQPSLPRGVTTLALDIVYSVISFTGPYDGQPHSVTANLEAGASILYSTDDGVSFTSSTPPEFINVGVYTVYYKVSKTGANDIIETAQVTINPLSITVVADNKTKALGEPDPPFTYTVTPALAVGDSFTGALTRSPGEEAGNYQINRGTLSVSTNYSMAFTPGVLNIGGVSVTVTPDSGQQKIYGETDPIITYSVNPSLRPGDTFTGQLSRVNGEDAGAYNILLGTLLAPVSYSVTLAPEVFTIVPRSVTITSDAKTKVFGEADPQLTFTVAPASIGNVFSGELGRTAGENVGSYPINQGTLTNPNYNIAFSGSVLTITKAPISRTFNSFVNTYEYTGSPIEPDIELIDSLTNQQLVKDTDYTLSYINNTNIGTATMVVTGIGNYQLSDNYNFQITPITATLTVDPIPDASYIGSAITPTVVVKSGSTVLTLGTDYTVEYNNHTFVGTANVIITGTGAYLNNNTSATFNIVRGTYSSTITNLDSLSRTFSPIASIVHPTISSNPENGTTTAYYATQAGGPYSTSAPVNAGTYFVKVSIAATANYVAVETPEESYTISPLATLINTFDKESGTTLIYTGDYHFPGEPAVFGVILEKNQDYTVSPDNSVSDVGDYVWTYTGINNYAGSSGTFTLKITPHLVQIFPRNASKKWGELDPELPYSATSLIESDTLTGQLGRDAGEDVGSYSYNVGTLTGGPNYRVMISNTVPRFTIEILNLPDLNPDWTSGDISLSEFNYTGSIIKPVVENWKYPTAPVVNYVYREDISGDEVDPIERGAYTIFAESATLNTQGNISTHFIIQ